MLPSFALMVARLIAGFDTCETVKKRSRAQGNAREIGQETLANKSGINDLSAVERSERNVSIDNLARIAGGLQANPEAGYQP